jgi:hypothetical protein
VGGYRGIVLPAGVEITCTERGRKGLGERERERVREINKHVVFMRVCVYVCVVCG